MNYIKKKIKEYENKFKTVKNLKITKSNREGKRFKATFTIKNIPKTVHFGYPGAFTYADGADEIKRKAYRARASKILSKGKPAYKIAGSAASFAWVILW